MSHLGAFGLGVLLATLGLLALERWASERERRFPQPPGWASGG